MRARIFSRLGFSVSGIFSPERTKRFFRNAWSGVIFRPGTHRIERRAAETEPAGDAESDSRETTHETKTPGTLHGPLPDFETRSFCPGTSGMIHRVAAIFEKVVMQINFHGASVRARAAEGRRIGEMVKLVNAAQMGSENAADWARISGAVSVAANSAKHRANIEAGAAANAMQHVALLDVREQFGSAIVEQHDVEFLGAVDLIRLSRAANQSVIAGDGLASACGGKDGPKQGEILEARNHFFDSRERDMNTRDAGAEAAIAFVGGEGNHAGIGDKEIGTADSHFGREKIAAQRAASGSNQLDRIVGIHVAQFLFEKISDVFPGEVHGRSDDVIGRLIA